MNVDGEDSSWLTILSGTNIVNKEIVLINLVAEVDGVGGITSA